MKIWIDTATGTYGNLDGLAIVDIPVEVVDQMDSGHLTDAEIAEWGDEAHRLTLGVPARLALEALAVKVDQL